MIDLHCHILPGVDDGAQTLEDSLLMAKKAVDQGITHILCSPHHNNGKYDNPADKVIPAVAALQDELDQRGIPLTLLEGQEVHVSGSVLKMIAAGEIVFIDLENRYLLLELPSGEVPHYTEKLCYLLRSKGYIPIIVHPERNRGIIKDPNCIIPFLEMGVLTQLTAPSIVGKFGKKIQHTAQQMLEHGMLHTVASDAHNIKSRDFLLKEAYEVIRERSGDEIVQSMMQSAKDIVNGDDTALLNFVEIEQGRRWFL